MDYRTRIQNIYPTKLLKRLFTTVFIFMLCALCNIANAQQINFVTEHLVPFQIVEKNKAISGFATEILQATMQLTPYTYTIEANPWPLSYKLAQKMTDTCIYSIARIPLRESLFQWVGEIARTNSSFFALKGSDIKLNTLEDAKKYVTAVIKDDFSHHFLRSKGFVENKNLYVMDNHLTLVEILEARKNRIDLMIVSDNLLRNRISVNTEIDNYKNIASFEDMSIKFNIACGLNTPPEVVNQMAKALNQIKQKGIFSAIEQKWVERLANEH